MTWNNKNIECSSYFSKRNLVGVTWAPTGAGAVAQRLVRLYEILWLRNAFIFDYILFKAFWYIASLKNLVRLSSKAAYIAINKLVLLVCKIPFVYFSIETS